jgi:uncharacterized Zn finger protein
MSSVDHEKISGRQNRIPPSVRKQPAPIAENIIHTWVGEVQFNRGLKYIEQSLLFHHSRRGTWIKAYCEGKRQGRQFYLVRANVIDGRIEKALCTCSIGKYGICPHIAALLVEYSRTPERFAVFSILRWLGQFLRLRK